MSSAWGCGIIPLKSAKEYQEVSKIRREWLKEEPLLFTCLERCLWEMFMARVYTVAINLGAIVRPPFDHQEKKLGVDTRQHVFSFR